MATVAALVASLKETDAEREFGERAQRTVKLALTERVIEGEEQHTDDSGLPYYYNTFTRVTSWTRPAANHC